MYIGRENIGYSYGEFAIHYSLLPNLNNFESDFCGLLEPETGHVTLL